jgi:hypothetical protein
MKSSNQGAVNKHTRGAEFAVTEVDRRSCPSNPRASDMKNRVVPSERSAVPVKKFNSLGRGVVRSLGKHSSSGRRDGSHKNNLSCAIR